MEECDTLFLDFNSMIHKCANDVLKQAPNLPHEEYYPLIGAAIIDALVNIVNVVRPIKRLYIAIDGPCPRAKMQQQRKRRYMTVWRKSRDPATAHLTWDSNVITPGTDFMAYLDNHLDLFIEKNKGKLGFEIQLSKSSARGEGEQKIFDVMIPGENAVIYGLDADLIMLSMIDCNSANIRLLREQEDYHLPKDKDQQQQNDRPKFSLLNIEVLKTEIKREYAMSIADYVMICVLLGNDFLPPLSYMSMRHTGLEVLMQAYHTVKKPIMDQSKGIEINMSTIKEILAVLAPKEDEKMDEACGAFYSTILNQDRGQSTKRYNKNKTIDCYPQYTKCEHVINPAVDPQWRDIYYKAMVKAPPPVACEEYFKGIAWVASYYFERNASFDWYYPFSYSPSIKDLAHVHQIPNTKTPIQKTFASKKQSTQLLLVLPPQSAHIIKDPKQHAIMTEVDSGFTHLYPYDFQISTFLKTYLWECCPVLPDMTSLA